MLELVPNVRSFSVKTELDELVGVRIRNNMQVDLSDAGVNAALSSGLDL